MSQFSAELREMADRLSLPPSTRVRIVRELSADLEDLAAALERRGVAPEEARREAMRTLVPSAETLAELNACHRPLYERLVDRFSDPARNRLERTLFGVALVSLAALGVTALPHLELYREPTRWTWLLSGLGVAGLGLALWTLFQLHVRRLLSAARLRRGLRWLPAIAATAVVGSLAAVVLDLYETAGILMGTGVDRPAVLLAWLQREMAVASLGLLVGALTLGLWLWLSAGIAQVARAERELQLNLEPEGETT